MGQQKEKQNSRKILTTTTSRSSLLAAILSVTILSSFSIQQTSALTCAQCCSCQGDSAACMKSGSPLFTFINKLGNVQCDITSNVCGTIRLMDITNNQPLTLKSCFHSNMCVALARLVGSDIPFFYLGEINTRVISVNCCNGDGCNASSAFLFTPSKLLIGAIALLLLVFFRR